MSNLQVAHIFQSGQTKINYNTLYFKQLGATIPAGLPVSSTPVTFALSNFDSNFVSANSDNAVKIAPGIYSVFYGVTIAHPASSTAVTSLMLNINLSGTSANSSYNSSQSIYPANWPANSSDNTNFSAQLFMPNGGTVSFTLTNQLGASIAPAISATIIISAVRLL